MERRSVLQSMLVAAGLQSGAQTTSAQTRKEPVFVAAGEDRFHEQSRLPNCKLSGKDTNGMLSIFASGDPLSLPPGDPITKTLGRPGVPLHVHHAQDEFLYVLDGEWIFQVGERKIRARSGDSIFGPRGIPHSLRQLSGTPNKLVSIFQPAGTMEEFLLEWAQMRRKEGRMPSPEQMADLFRAHGMEIVGPVVEP